MPDSEDYNRLLRDPEQNSILVPQSPKQEFTDLCANVR